ncbi:MAG: hypothetical protein DRP11_05460 [Candidatus Aenigmatarchaeota archaeon]|nr:MAG: hypothetical protein DRP11_05460 [Candidatus Aenigmarchaeota archaeon]
MALFQITPRTFAIGPVRISSEVPDGEIHIEPSALEYENLVPEDGRKIRAIVRPYLDNMKPIPLFFQPMLDVWISYDIEKGCALPESFIEENVPNYISDAFKNNKVKFVQIKTELSFLYDRNQVPKSLYFLENLINTLNDRLNTEDFNSPF